MRVQQIGQLIDQLGVTAEVEDGEVSLLLATSESLTWLDQLGLLVAARDVCDQDGYRRKNEDS